MASLLVGIYSVTLATEKTLSSFLVLGGIYFGTYLHRQINQYVSVTEHKIVIHEFPGKEINFSEITEKKKFAGEYIFRSAKKEIRINTSVMDKESVAGLEAFYGEFEVQNQSESS